MPRTNGGPDELGIRYEGDVLNGKLTVKEAFDRQARQAGTTLARRVQPEQYDPVLRFHLGIPEPPQATPEELAMRAARVEEGRRDLARRII